MKTRFLRYTAALALTAGTLSALAQDESPLAPSSEHAEATVRLLPLRPALSAETIHAILLGQLALRNGQWQEALAAFAQAAQGAPDDPSLLEQWAQAALLAGNAAQFERVLLLWRWRFPEDPGLRAMEAHRNRVNERFTAQLADQIAALLRNHPESLEQNLLGLPAALAELGDNALMLRLIEEVTAPYRNEPAAQLILSEAARQAWQLDLAWQAVQRAVALRPNWPLVWAQWAQVAMDRFAADEALPALNEAAQRLPNDRTIAIALAMLYGESRTPERALPLLARILANHPKDEAVVGLIAALGSQGVAPAQADRLLRTAAANPKVPIHRARMWLARHQPQRALTILNGFHPPEPLAQEVRQLRAQALARLGRVEAALDLLERFQPLDEVDEAIRTARLLVEAKRLADARLLLQKAMLQLGDEPTLLYEYSLVLERIGERSLAEGYLRKLIALRPFDVHALNALGYLLADTNQALDEAERLILLARRLQPNDGFIIDSEGWLRFRQGRISEARALLEQAWRRNPDREIGEHLIAVYEAMGDAPRAQAWRDRLARQFPTR